MHILPNVMYNLRRHKIKQQSDNKIWKKIKYLENKKRF